MKLFNRYILVALISLLAIGSTAYAQVQVFAQIDDSADIYIGQNFAFHIIIDGDNQPGRPDLTPLKNFNPRNAGSRDVSQTSIRMVNGKTTKNIVKRYVMSYSLISNQPGEILIPSLDVVVDGQTYKTNPVQVNVIEPGTTDKLELLVNLSENQCYVGQPIVMNVKFFVSTEIGDFRFNIPALDNGEFYIEDPDVSSKNVKQFQLSNGTSIFVTQSRVLHNNKDAVLLEFDKILIPKAAGKIEIAASTVSADVVIATARSRGVFGNIFGGQKEYKRFMVSAPPLSLDVLPLPQTRKPADFYGLSGRYTISGSAEPAKVNVGDPITLTIRIGGNKFLKPVQWPDLESISELAANFKIPLQKSSPIVKNGYKVFTQTIRANNDKVTEIPSIPLSFFDPDKGDYVTITSDPIRLDVAPTKVLTGADLEGMDFSPINREVETIKKGISANYQGREVLKNMSFSPISAAFSSGHTFIWAMPFAALIASLIAKPFVNVTDEKLAKKTKRLASSKAVKALHKISHEPSEQKHELLAAAMTQYIADRFQRIAGSLTPDECSRIIIDNTAGASAADEFKTIIEQCQAARFASIDIQIDSEKIAKVITLIKNIEKSIKR